LTVPERQVNIPAVSIDPAEAYRTLGYVIVPEVFPKEEILKFRRLVQILRERELAEGKNVERDPDWPNVLYVLGDLLAKEELRALDYLVFHPKIVSLARLLLGPDLVYFGDSTVQVGQGRRGFHKDNVTRYDPQGADWKGDYPLLRIGLYLQDHTRWSGGLKVRAGSHLLPSYHDGRAVNVPSGLGDVVAWNLRTTHSGNALRLRGFHSLCLHPRLEQLLPAWLSVPEADERMALFCTFGAPGEHLDRYIEDYGKREDCRRYMQRSCINAELRELARRERVEIRMPAPDYGSLHPRHQALPV
jgi:hypothetical protein